MKGCRWPTRPHRRRLSRGIRILEILADAREPLMIDEVARRLDVHRSVAYRLLRTLEDHGLVARDGAGRIELGVPHRRRWPPESPTTCRPRLSPSSPRPRTTSAMTCFLTVLDHDDCVTLMSVEPRHAVASVAQRPGSRHPVAVGAPGRAILTQLPPGQWPEGADAARDRGCHGPRLRAEPRRGHPLAPRSSRCPSPSAGAHPPRSRSSTSRARTRPRSSPSASRRPRTASARRSAPDQTRAKPRIGLTSCSASWSGPSGMPRAVAQQQRRDEPERASCRRGTT